MITEITIITTSLRNDPCDYAKQTMSEIRKAGLPVSIIWLSERKSVIRWCSDYLHNIRPDTSSGPGIEMCKIVPFERFETIKKINTLLNLFFILRAKKNENKENVFWFFEPFPSSLVKNLFHGTKIYDCLDYFPAISPEVEKEENELIDFVDAVFVCNSTLYKKMRGKTSKVFLVGQGFDQETFSSARNVHLNSIRYARHQKLTFLFVGTICSRIDFKLLHEVITDNPQDKFVFVGPILKEFQTTTTFDQDVENIFKLKNVKYLGVKKKKEVAQLIIKADACLIPYSLNNLFNRFSFPLKTSEYFYFGKPVFAIPTPEMKRLKNLVFCFKNKKDFQTNLKELKTKGWSATSRKRQRHFSLQQTWSKKIQNMLQHFC